MPRLSTWKKRIFGFLVAIWSLRVENVGAFREQRRLYSGYLIRPDFGLRKAIHCVAPRFAGGADRGCEARNVASAEISCSDNFAAIAGIVWLTSFDRTPEPQSRSCLAR